MAKLSRLLTPAILLAALAQRAWATMIVVVYTKDGYWIGADSLRSGYKKPLLVCKIHETNFGLLAKSGNAQGETELGTSYSTDKEIEDLLATSQTANLFKAQLRDNFRQEVDQELALLIDDPRVNASNLQKIEMDLPVPSNIEHRLTRELIFFDTTSTDPTGEILSVRPESDMQMSTSFAVVYRYHASLDGWHPVRSLRLLPTAPLHFASSVRQFSHIVQYERSDIWIQDHPKQAIQEMLEIGHTEDSKHIAPPYSIVHVAIKDGVRPEIVWVVNGVCPGWSETINDNSLTKLRDEMRQHKRSSTQ